MTHKIPRRSFLQASGALAAMTTLPACSTSNDAISLTNSKQFPAPTDYLTIVQGA